MIEEIERRLIEGLETGNFEVLLFHGSGELWEGEPQKGGDGLFWTAKSAVIAQQYIPASGSAYIVSPPRPFQCDDRVKPERHSFWATVARQMTGKECTDVEFNAVGELTSWRVPAGWPTYGQCQSWLESALGYRWNGEYDQVDVKTAWIDGVERLMRSDWFLDGTLLVTLSDGLSFRDIRKGAEGDLMDLEYHDYVAFEAAGRDGLDGVVINDFAQTDDGNVGHVSYGLTSHALERLKWVSLPARRHRYAWSQNNDVTEAITLWAESHRSVYVPGSLSP